MLMYSEGIQAGETGENDTKGSQSDTEKEGIVMGNVYISEGASTVQ